MLRLSFLLKVMLFYWVWLRWFQGTLWHHKELTCRSVCFAHTFWKVEQAKKKRKEKKKTFLILLKNWILPVFNLVRKSFLDRRQRQWCSFASDLCAAERRPLHPERLQGDPHNGLVIQCEPVVLFFFDLDLLSGLHQRRGRHRRLHRDVQNGSQRAEGHLLSGGGEGNAGSQLWQKRKKGDGYFFCVFFFLPRRVSLPDH